MSSKQDQTHSRADEALSTQSTQSTIVDEFADLSSETDRQFDTWLRTLKDPDAIHSHQLTEEEFDNYQAASPGEIRFEGTLCVDGHVSVFVHSSAGKLVVSEAGEINGDISVGEAIINGKVRGDIKSPSVSLGSTARVIGDIETCALSIEPGATFEGQCTFPASVDDENAEGKVEPEQACAVAAVN